MDILSRLRADLVGAKRSQIEALAVDMGIPKGTLRKIVSGRTPNPQYKTVQAIQLYYDRLPVAPPALRLGEAPEVPQQAAGSSRRRQMA